MSFSWRFVICALTPTLLHHLSHHRRTLLEPAPTAHPTNHPRTPFLLDYDTFPADCREIFTSGLRRGGEGALLAAVKTPSEPVERFCALVGHIVQEQVKDNDNFGARDCCIQTRGIEHLRQLDDFTSCPPQATHSHCRVSGLAELQQPHR